MAMLDVAPSWLGRVIDPLGEATRWQGHPVRRGQPAGRPGPPRRKRPRARGSGPRIDLGVRALNCFATCRQGQRLGLFSGSGVGKSTLLSMLTRGTECDVAVLALVGERGREVREFLEDDLGPDGHGALGGGGGDLGRAAAAAPPGAYAAMTVAEHFRDQGRSVLLLMDSVTRFCLALREIGLSAGEPPATRGYPPSVFAELPRLLERAGPGLVRPDGTAGQITGAVHRAGGGRRPQRAGGRRGARHPGRARHPGPPDRRRRPLSGGGRAAVAVARRCPCLDAEETAMLRPGAAHPGAAWRHGGHGAARRLSSRHRSGGGRGVAAGAADRGFAAAVEGRSFRISGIVRTPEPGAERFGLG